ncbi:MAG: hypothetical protein ABL883_10250 [Terricaulis sp.]
MPASMASRPCSRPECAFGDPKGLAGALALVERVLAPGGIERMGRATVLLGQLGWRIVDERCVKDGARLMAANVVAERPA